MPVTSHIDIRRLRAEDAEVLDALLDLFGAAFDDETTYYGAARPSVAYRRRLLASEAFIALVAMERGRVVGGLAAYELPKFEQERSEIYIYDLAVATTHRRRGIASAMIDALKPIAASRGAWVIFVQADHGDEPAIALYNKFGDREDVLHFDIPVGEAAVEPDRPQQTGTEH